MSEAEKIAIALLSESRSLYNGEVEGHLSLADRLAQWATDVRQLGVDQARLRDSWADQMRRKDRKIDELREDLGIANAEVGRLHDEIEKVAKRWDHTAVSSQLRKVLDGQ